MDSRFNAAFFAVISIVLQFIFFITKSEFIVTISKADYIIRIAIIAVSYICIDYLTQIHTKKVKAYEKFAKPQEILEKISSNFISLNKDNANNKIDELFEMSASILHFDYALLLEFSDDFENTTIINTYTNNAITKIPFRYQQGQTSKTSSLPVVGWMINHKQPIVCENIADISFREHEAARNYFMAQNINSFFAIPIMIDDRIDGILAIEYNNPVESNDVENQLSILTILANILGDAKKKILYEEKLHKTAYFDKSTNLANKNLLVEKFKSIISNEKESKKIAVLDIEIENLKLINETFGYIFGETVIQKTASILKDLFQDSIIIARTEGKEFIVVTYYKKESEIRKRAEKISNFFSLPLFTETGIKRLFVIINIGISVYPENARDAITLLENAELAGKYARTTDGKIAFYKSQMKDYITETALLTNRLFHSLQNREFYLEFQPQVDATTEKVVGVEALLRLTPENGKRIGPDRFIPILENTGLIYDVGYWVLKQSIIAHQQLIENGFPPLRFSVNVSAVQFRKDDFVKIISNILQSSQIDPQYIELELTESAISEDLSETIEKMLQLKKLGVTVAIDDFGKGYSSLHRLEAMPFDRIKIDKSITDRI
ncbi:MAG: EAL domain-containing protein, partial [Treponema sp.]|nr:EAL domain-containing protein [Treponema sp.]